MPHHNSGKQARQKEKADADKREAAQRAHDASRTAAFSDEAQAANGPQHESVLTTNHAQRSLHAKDAISLDEEGVTIESRDISTRNSGPQTSVVITAPSLRGTGGRERRAEVHMHMHSDRTQKNRVAKAHQKYQSAYREMSPATARRLGEMTNTHGLDDTEKKAAGARKQKYRRTQ